MGSKTLLKERFGEIQKLLEEELKKLKESSRAGYELKVAYSPDPSNKLSGRVEGATIYIYEEDLSRAVDTLRHEFIDYLVSKAIKPYRDLLNALIERFNEEAYRGKEEVVEALVRLFSSSIF